MARGASAANSPPHRFSVAGCGKPQLTVDLPSLNSLDGVELDLGAKEIQLRLPGDLHTSRISLPLDFAGAPTAKFSKKRGQLIISWPEYTEDHDYVIIEEPQSNAPTAVANEHDDAVIIEELDSGTQFAAACEPSASAVDDAPAVSSSQQAAREQAGCASDSCSQAAVPQTTACGSIWNPKSWHWEEKNCLELVRKGIEQRLSDSAGQKLKHVLDLSGGSVVFSKLTVEGDASFLLRRGRRMLCYELAVSFKWEVRDEYGGQLGAKGSGSISELTQEDELPRIQIEVSTTFSGGAEAKAAGKWMKEKGSRILAEWLRGPDLSAAVLNAEEARVDMHADATLRAEEKAKAEAAEKATNEERIRLAAEQTQREESQRIQPSEGAVNGSLWNVNAWHWEEKPMNDWAHNWLKQGLCGMTLSLLGGMAEANLSEPKVTGDASVSVRKGKPIALFQLCVECTWNVTASVAGIGEAKGRLRIPEFTSEDGRLSAIEVEALSGPGGAKPSGQVVGVFRRDAIVAIRSILGEFEDELRSRATASK